SLVYRDASSSLDLGWALAAIAWGAVFIAAAELTKNAEGSTLLGSPRGDKVATSAQSEPAAQHSSHVR
ncbi:MAG: hypothetical protein ACRD0U_14870, partial [Acidimicrobiales bacterium]